MQKNCTKNEVKNSKSGIQSKNYKSRLQKYVKQQQKIPEKQTHTAEKIITSLVIDTLQESEELGTYNSTLLNVFQESLWNFQISNSFMKKIIYKNQKIQSIISSMLMVADGYFEFNSKKVSINYIRMPLLMQFQCFFMISSTDNYFILFEVGLHKVQQEEANVKCYLSQEFIGFDVIHKITFIDIFFYQKAQEFTDTLQQYQIQIQKDFYRIEFQGLVCQSPPLPPKNMGLRSYLFNLENKEQFESIFKLQNDKLIQWVPLQFKSFSLSKNNFILDTYTNKYIEKEFHKRQKNLCHNEEQANQNKYQIQYLADFQSAGAIIDILQKTAEFKIRISNQEREVISTPNNALVIGRSGTGKTTSIVLRIFALETLIKVKAKVCGLKNLQFLNDYQGKPISVRSVFTTANRYLVKEVEKYYQKLEKQAQDAIAKHRESKTFDLEESFISQTYSEITNFEDDVLDFVFTDHFDKVEEQNQENHIYTPKTEQNLQEIQSFQQAQFPAFLSTQQLLILLDKQMEVQFLSQQFRCNLKNKHLKRIGFLDCNGINLDEHYPESRTTCPKDKEFYGSSYQQQQVIVPEVDFMIFYQQFWPTVATPERGNKDVISLPSSFFGLDLNLFLYQGIIIFLQISQKKPPRIFIQGKSCQSY